MYGEFDPFTARLLSGERPRDEADEYPEVEPPVDAQSLRWSLIATVVIAVPILVWAALTH